MKRKIINIDQEKCTGCGLCIPNCPEGAIQLLDGKARLVSDLACDGLGACLGHCPENAITIEEREAAPYDEKKAMENIVKQGRNTIKAHLEHLKAHGQCEYLEQAVAVLDEKGIENPLQEEDGTEMKHDHAAHHEGCPGAKSRNFRAEPAAGNDEAGKRESQLTHWPVQLHLMQPSSPQYQGADALLAADCTAFTLGDFHRDWLRGKALAIACPKLDDGREEYVEKIRALIDEAKINTLTVMVMEVPCCMGLMELAREAAGKAARKIPVKQVVVGIQGKILSAEWGAMR